MSEKTIAEVQDEIVEEFGLFEDWTDRYAYIVELGKKLPKMDESLKTDDKIIKGCQSRVWLHPKMEENKLYFETDSDAIIVKGLIYLLVRILSGHKPSEISNTDLYFIDKIGMTQHLSPTRSNGLASMVKQMKLYALALDAQQKQA
jgi:cysteine desulfuration protein SufE